MPLIKKKSNETEKEYVARCIPDLMNKDPKREQKQAIAICYSEFGRQVKKESIKEKINFKKLSETIEGDKEIFYVGKNLTDEEARKLTIKKVKKDHRGFSYDPKTGKVVYT